MKDPVTWLVDRIDVEVIGRNRPLDRPICLIASLTDAEAIRLQSQAPLSSEDYRDFAHRADAFERLARRRIAKVLLAAVAGCTPIDVKIGRTAGGAPEIIYPSGWHLSVAGRWPLVAIGVGYAPLGVDLELTTEPAPPDDCFVATELRSLCGSQQDQRLMWWCAKEAHAKLSGRASQMTPQDIVLIRTADGLSGQSEMLRSDIRTWVGESCVAAVATGRA